MTVHYFLINYFDTERDVTHLNVNVNTCKYTAFKGPTIARTELIPSWSYNKEYHKSQYLRISNTKW